jgi:hypothetical protein
MQRLDLVEMAVGDESLLMWRVIGDVAKQVRGDCLTGEATVMQLTLKVGPGQGICEGGCALWVSQGNEEQKVCPRIDSRFIAKWRLLSLCQEKLR